MTTISPHRLSICLSTTLLLSVFAAPPAGAKVYNLRPSTKGPQTLVVYKGQERVFVQESVEVYASCFAATDRNGIAMFELGVRNLSEEAVRFDPTTISVQDNKGSILKVLTIEEAHKAVQTERADLEMAASRARENAQAITYSQPTLGELVGDARAQSRSERISEQESFGEPLASPERKQKQHDLDERIREATTAIRREAARRNQMIDEYYLKPALLQPGSALNGILMLKIEKKPKSITIVTEVDNEKYPLSFNVVK